MNDKEICRAGELLRTVSLSKGKSLQRILVVDDDIVIRHFTTLMLIKSGFEVEAAFDGAAGWAALQANHYDLLITDNSMPRITGVEMIELLHHAEMDTPVIMATGLLPTQEMKHHPWLREIDILIKPFPFKDLLFVVTRILGASQKMRAQTAPA